MRSTAVLQPFPCQSAFFKRLTQSMINYQIQGISLQTAKGDKNLCVDYDASFQTE